MFTWSGPRENPMHKETAAALLEHGGSLRLPVVSCSCAGAHHLQVAASRGALDDVRLGPHIVDDRPLEPRHHEVRALRIHLPAGVSVAAPAEAAVPRGGTTASKAHRVLDAHQPVEDDGSVAALHVEDAVGHAVHAYSADDCQACKRLQLSSSPPRSLHSGSAWRLLAKVKGGPSG